MTDLRAKTNDINKEMTINEMIDGAQCTVCIHVDDGKLSHRKKEVVDGMIEWFKSEFEQMFEDGTGEMSVHRGKAHECLGMKLLEAQVI